MAFAQISGILTFAVIFQGGLHPTIADSQEIVPTFRLAQCEVDGDLCIKVTFADREEDLIVADEYHTKGNANHDVYKGKLKNDVTNAKVVVVLSQDPKVKDLIVFKSDKVPGCRKYRVSLKESGEASCTKGLDWEKLGLQKTIRRDNLKPPPINEETRKELFRGTKERQINPDGYKVTAAVYYDDLFKNDFGESADRRIATLMALVDEQFDEMKIEIDVEVIAVEYKEGQNWGQRKGQWDDEVLCEEEGCVAYDIPMASDHNANVYVFITGKSSVDGLGLAWEGVACDKRRYMRTSITKYHKETDHENDHPEDVLAEDEATAETLTHEIGHNLGLKHDFQEDSNGNPIKINGEKVPRQVKGVDCTGYMDYKDHTVGWSTCSYLDFIAFIKSPNFCLSAINKNKDEYYEEERRPRKRFMQRF